MNNKLIMLGYMVLVGGVVPASACGPEAASCGHTTKAAETATEEAVFVSKLTPAHVQAFNLMSIEQRREALEVARNGILDADAAIDAILKKYHLAVQGDSLKTAVTN